MTIQIPTWRNPAQLETTLKSLFLHTEYPFKVVVINNDGTEEGKVAIEEQLSRFPVDSSRLELIHSGSNLGWMGAHNLALESCSTPYVCLLNDDVIFPPYCREFWRELTLPLNNPKIGATGPSSNFVMGSQNIHNVDLPPIDRDWETYIGG